MSKEDLERQSRREHAFEEGRQPLLRQLETKGEGLGAEAVLAILRSPFCDRKVIEKLLSLRRLLVDHAVRLELVHHRETPEPRAIRLLATLYWRDLARLGADVRVHPRLRQAAERRLGDRLPTMSVGEKIAISRIAGQGLLKLLRREKDPAVVSAMLLNPRTTESLVLSMADSFETSPEVLKMIGQHQKWRHRLNVCTALCRNPRTPQAVALGVLSGLRKQDLRLLARDRRVPAALRRRAEMMLGREFPRNRI